MPTRARREAAKGGARIVEPASAMDIIPLARAYCFLGSMVVIAAE
jgi:hypothetical protein